MRSSEGSAATAAGWLVCSGRWYIMSGNDIGCAVGWWLIKHYQQSHQGDGKHQTAINGDTAGTHDAVIATFSSLPIRVDFT